MRHKRWYDKNENIRELIESLKETNKNDLDSIALDIIQLMFQKQADKDDFLETLSKHINSHEDRWYDNDYMFQSALEMLKFFPEATVERILKETFSPWHEIKRTDDIDNYEDFHRH